MWNCLWWIRFARISNGWRWRVDCGRPEPTKRKDRLGSDPIVTFIQQRASMKAEQHNILVLAICQALFICAISIDLTLTSLTGYELAPNKLLATLPFALITVVGALVTLFASVFMQKYGRRAGFVIGALFGASGGIVSFWSVFHGHFWFFCLGTSAVGIFQAFAQYYRLAAADSARSEEKSRAISTVLAGGVIAAIVGPALAAWSKGIFPRAIFAGSYMVVAMLGGLSAIILAVFYRDRYRQHPGVPSCRCASAKSTHSYCLSAYICGFHSKYSRRLSRDDANNDCRAACGSCMSPQHR